MWRRDSVTSLIVFSITAGFSWTTQLSAAPLRQWSLGAVEFLSPDHDHVPAGFPQNAVILRVSGFVCADLVLPEFDIRFRHAEFAAAVVPVPETAVDEDHGAVFPQND